MIVVVVLALSTTGVAQASCTKTEVGTMKKNGMTKVQICKICPQLPMCKKT